MQTFLSAGRAAWLFVAAAAGAAHATVAPEDPEPGIWLEMALLACERGDRANAEKFFQHIEENFSPPPGIRALIAQARVTSCPPAEAIKGRINAGIGWSSNVNKGPLQTRFALPGPSPLELRLTPEFQPRADNFVFAEGERGFPLGPGVLQIFGSLRHHVSMQDFDEDRYGLAWQMTGSHSRRPVWRAAAVLSQTLLGSERYADHFAVSASLQWSSLSLSAQWRAIDYPRAHAFDARQTLVRIGSEMRWNGWQVIFRAGLLRDDASGARPGGDRQGWLADVHASRPGPFGSSFEIGWSGERHRSNEAYLPGLFDMRREQRVSQFDFAWLTPLDHSTTVRISLQSARSHDSVPFLAYRQTTVGISHIWLWR